MTDNHPAWELAYRAVLTVLHGDGDLRDRLAAAWNHDLSVLRDEALMEPGDPGWDAWTQLVDVFDEGNFISQGDDALPEVAEHVLDLFVALGQEQHP